MSRAVDPAAVGPRHSARDMARAGGLHRVGVFVLLAGAFLPLADFFIVNVALPTIGRSLHGSAAMLELVVAAYGVSYAALLVLGGRLGDRIGRLRLFEIGTAGFVTASAVCGLASDMWVLVSARLVQGAMAALLVPQVLATFHACLENEQKTRALALYGATSGIAAVISQAAGGFLVTADVAGLSWRPVFLINVPLGLAVLWYARRVVPTTRSEHPTSIDLPGTLLFAATLVAILLPLAEGVTLGWPAWIFVLIVLGVVLGGATSVIESRAEAAGKTPFLPPSTLKLRSVSRGLAMLLPFSVGFGAFMFIFALTVQDGLTVDALVGGLSITPMAAMFLAGSILSPKILNRYGVAAIRAGAIAQAVGLGLLITIMVASWPHVSLFSLAGPLALIGAGQSMLFTGYFRLVLTDVPVHQAGIGGGVLITLQQAGLALGVATLGSIYLALYHESIPAAFGASVGVQLLIATCLAVATRFLPRLDQARATGL